MMSKFYEVLGVKVSQTNLNDACRQIVEWIEHKNKTYVCIAPVATIVEAQKNKEYRDIVNNAGMVTPDGMPLVWLGQRRGLTNVARTYGPDLLQTLSRYGEDKDIRHFFYGGTEESLAGLTEKLKAQFPNLNIVGTLAPGKKDLGAIESDKVCQQINAAQPDVLWIGLGSPKQDIWMSDHRGLLEVPVMIGVGAAFDFISGLKKQAPRWMQRSGLEWLFRLGQEPRRLWKRYLLGNFFFIFHLIKSKFVKPTH